MNASVSYRYFKHPRPNLTKIGQNEVLFLTLPLVTLPFTLQHKQRNVRCYLKSLGWLALTYACSRSPVSEVPRLLRPLHMSLVTETNFALGSYEKFQPGFRDELKAFSSPEPVVSWSRGRLQIKPSGSGDENGDLGTNGDLGSWGRVLAPRDKKSRHAKHKNYKFRAYHSFCNS